MCVDLGAEQLPCLLPALLGPVYREISDSTKRAGEELYNLAQEVVDLIKNVCGREAFSIAYAQVHQTVSGVRQQRRKQAALEVWLIHMTVHTNKCVLLVYVCRLLLIQRSPFVESARRMSSRKLLKR